jgi:hypothetical protein
LESIKNYSIAFFFVFFGFLAILLPQLIFFDPFLIQIDFILVDLFFLGAVFFFISNFFKISGLFRCKEIFSRIIFSWILVYIFLNVIFFSPAIPFKFDNAIYYWKSGTLWLQTINRGILILGILIISYFFFKWAKALEKALFWRSFITGLGTLLITVAGFIFWFFPFFYFSPFLLNLSGYLCLAGFLAGLSGAIIFHPQPSNNGHN